VTQPSPNGHPASFTILVNGEPRRVPAGSSLADLVRELGLGERRFAAAVNREVVPRGAHSGRRLAADDRIEILEAVGGG
jgi:thiamine biosynthesis protein ThiS